MAKVGNLRRTHDIPVKTFTTRQKTMDMTFSVILTGTIYKDHL